MKFKVFFSLVAFSLVTCTFADIIPLPNSINCNLSNGNLVCQGIPEGMIIKSHSYPAIAGVYTFRYNLIADVNYDYGFFAAHYVIDGKEAELELGNDDGYAVDIRKTLNQNSYWQTSVWRSIDECKSLPADCGVELTH